MPVIYGLMFLLALALVVICVIIDRGQSRCLLFLSLSIAVCDLGHHLLSVSKSLNAALWANRATYLGQVFLPAFILMMLLGLCKVRYPRWLPAVLTVVNLVMLAIVMTPGVLPWYYASVDIARVDGATQLVRTYGPLAKVYHLYLLGYMAAGVGVIVHTSRKGAFYSVEHAWLLLMAVLGNIIIWVVEWFLPRGFEFLTISYVITEIFILTVYSGLQEVSRLRRDAQTAPQPQPQLGGIVTFTDAHIQQVLDSCPQLGGFNQRELDILRHLLADRPRREIAQAMYLSESSIKKYTASIFQKLEVKDRKELFQQMAQYL